VRFHLLTELIPLEPMNRFSFLPAVLAGASVALVANALPAAAVTFDLAPTYVNTGNSNPVLPTGQLAINVAEYGTNQVRFTISNNASTPSRIFEVMFGKNTNFSNLMSWSGLIDRDDNVALGGNAYNDVDFNQDTQNPKDPPGVFRWDSSFTALRDGNSRWGVDPGQSLGVLFTLNQGATFSQVQQGFNSQNLAVALHVGSLSNGGSDWYGTDGVTTKDVPEPLTMLGTAAALGFGGLFQRQRNKQQKAQARA
jgi:hypothetical protein